MKITKQQLKQIIKEELQEMMGSIPDRGIEQIEGFERIQQRLENEFTQGNPFDAARHFDMEDVDKMETLAYRLSNYQENPVVVGFLDFIGHVVEAVRDGRGSDW